MKDKKKTLVFKINSAKPNKKIVDLVTKAIKNGKIVVFPTETVYGLGTGVFNKRGILKIYQLRKRPKNKALLILISRKKDLKKFVKSIPLSAKTLIKKFWPGPLTIIFSKKKNVPDFVTAGKKTIAVRMPENKFLLSLIRKLNRPIVAPSANLSGQKSPITVDEVIKNFFGKVDLILDGGATKYKKESTLIDLTTQAPKIIRKGAIKNKEIEKYL